jgi:molybdopterin synthase catalytic subunit
MFGALAEAAARDEEFDLEDEATAGDVLRAVVDRYPAAEAIVARCAVAVDEVVVPLDHAIRASSDVAVLPPASGGSVDVRLTPEPWVGRAIEAVSMLGAGGTAVFVGTVRDRCDAGAVERLEYSAYDTMAEKVMAEIANEAMEKWTLLSVAIEHGIGSREVGDITFVVACAAAHRDEAFDACRYITDEVKRRAPIWKKEIGPWGRRWVGL